MAAQLSIADVSPEEIPSGSPAYRTNPDETKELEKQVGKLLEKATDLKRITQPVVSVLGLAGRSTRVRRVARCNRTKRRCLGRVDARSQNISLGFGVEPTRWTPLLETIG
ncbi:hypothetical protein CCACVL1_08281 [Corchorus capsularis]|uniref:Uncharacterized protein n=1 Tax=Corchorus capsularis TaxID=210143 RepID=A0A1R3J1F5_COCAP|nr:hypothetical protein CCACVL1_08281 [Corchorus capsularis]